MKPVGIDPITILCHAGVESQQPAALSSAAAAAASALHPVSSKQLPQLTSIQLLKHRARQHVANAGAHSFTASIPNLHSFPKNPNATDQAGTPAMTSTAQIDLTQTSGAAEQSSSAVASGPAQIDLTQEPPDVNQSGLPSTAGTAQLGLPPGGVLRSTQPGGTHNLCLAVMSAMLRLPGQHAHMQVQRLDSSYAIPMSQALC